jgi:hypothetical protein
LSKDGFRELETTIWAHRVRVLADQQERPTRQIAALRKPLAAARKLREQLKALPTSFRTDLQAPDVEILIDHLVILLSELVDQGITRSKYLKKHVFKHRQYGGYQTNLSLRQQLIDLISRYCPDPQSCSPDQKRRNERKRRSWVAFASKKIGARYPNEKKNRARFIGSTNGPRPTGKIAKMR